MLCYLVGGCATQTVPIVESQEHDSAKVRFINKMGRTWIDLYPETECNKGVNVIYDNVINNAVRTISEGSPKRVGMLDPQEPTNRNIAEYSFKPGQLINIGVGGNPRGRCLGGLSFIAAPSMQYEVVLSEQQSGRCTLAVQVLSTVEDRVQRQPMRDIRPLVCKRAY